MWSCLGQFVLLAIGCILPLYGLTTETRAQTMARLGQRRTMWGSIRHFAHSFYLSQFVVADSFRWGLTDCAVICHIGEEAFWGLTSSTFSQLGLFKLTDASFDGVASRDFGANLGFSTHSGHISV